MATRNTIDATDKRNPTYYERRAGHPAPTANWYIPRDPITKNRVRPAYTKETFVIGKDMTCGTFYQYRNFTAKRILEAGLEGKDWKKEDVRWDVEDVFVKVAKQLTKNGRRDHIPAYCRDYVTRDLIGSVDT